MCSITINGEKKSFQERPLLTEILATLEIPTSAVAVEVNRRIVPRSFHSSHRLEDGDEVEIVTFVGGG